MTDLILEIDELGTKRWRNKKGQLHRENGPAKIFPNGEIIWFINDKQHRIDGPSAVYIEHKHWRIKGEFIRHFSYD